MVIRTFGLILRRNAEGWALFAATAVDAAPLLAGPGRWPDPWQYEDAYRTALARGTER